MKANAFYLLLGGGEVLKVISRIWKGKKSNMENDFFEKPGSTSLILANIEVDLRSIELLYNEIMKWEILITKR